jgi:hypothetical protein
MMNRLGFLLMAIAQALFALRALLQPHRAKDGNIQRKTIYAKMPLWFYRCVGVLCAGLAVLFFYLFLKPPLN